MLDRIGTRLFLTTAVILGIASVAVIAFLNYSMRQQALREAEAKALLILNRNLATHSYFSHELKPRVFELSDRCASTEYFEPAWMSSTFAVRRIDGYFSALTGGGFYYKESAINARSPQNEADELERAFIRTLNSDPKIDRRSGVRVIDGQPFFYTMVRGETLERSCLRCHSTPAAAPGRMVAAYGPDRSFHRAEGEVVSAISIRVPLTAAYGDANRLSLELSAFLLVVLAGVWAANHALSRRYLLRPLASLRDRAVAIATDERALGQAISEPQGRELRELASAFTRMSATIKAHVDTLEARVGERTADLEQANERLRGALAEVRRLGGLVPICSACKRIRDDRGYWNQLEAYIGERSEAQFTHGICPDCATRLYGEDLAGPP